MQLKTVQMSFYFYGLLLAAHHIRASDTAATIHHQKYPNTFFYECHINLGPELFTELKQVPEL